MDIKIGNKLYLFMNTKMYRINQSKQLQSFVYCLVHKLSIPKSLSITVVVYLLGQNIHKEIDCFHLAHQLKVMLNRQAWFNIKLWYYFFVAPMASLSWPTLCHAISDGEHN